MTSLLSLRRTLQPHLSDDALTRLVSQERSRARGFVARRHLDRCGPCRARYESLARAALSVARHRQHIISQLEPLSSARRNMFLQQLDMVLESPPPGSWWKQPLARLEIRPFGKYEPSLAGALSAAFAAILLLALWHSQLRSVSASEFIDRAVASDRIPGETGGPGVIRRRFRIQTTQKTIERFVYLDAAGRREPKPAGIGSQDADLAARLALAGVNWDDPLSAVSFKNWHDSQKSLTDDVRPSGQGLLTMRTRLGSTLVANESFTVTQKGFHPVERVIEYREGGAVDISEISLDLLSWNKTDELFFEPLDPNRAPGRPSPVRELPLGAAEMNEAELRARLILNQQNADTGEQIEIRRDDKGVEVRGLVESQQRKIELSESLQGVPFLTVAIQSFDDLGSHAEPDVLAVPIEQRSSVAVVSPLAQYFFLQDRGRDDLSRISAGLFNLSLAINRASRSIDQIRSRFSGNSDLTTGAINARDQLLARTAAQLADAVSQQRRLLEEANITPVPAAVASFGPQAGFLVDLAERNVALTQELVSGPSESGRSGPAIAAELARTITELQSRANQFDAIP
jgi:hypothetical protein